MSAPFNENQIRRSQNGDPNSNGTVATKQRTGGDVVLDAPAPPVTFTKVDDNTVIVPAGTYFLGDPCYPVSHEDWDVAGDSAPGGWGSDEPIRTLPGGHNLVFFGTAYGDGTYEGSDGFGYAVDSGTLGLVPEAAWTRQSEEDRDRNALLGTTVTFNEPTTVRHEGSKIIAGHITIDTDPPAPRCGRCDGEMGVDDYECVNCDWSTCNRCGGDFPNTQLDGGRCQDCPVELDHEDED